MKASSLMFIVGEASADAHAAALIRELRRLSPDIQLFGAGGPQMKAAGMGLTVDLTEHAVVGLVEVLKNYGKFRRIFWNLVREAEKRQPDAVVLVDFPGFNLRFAAQMKKRGIKVTYYISPQLWAWHASRAKQIERDVDLMLTIFPFEKAWYAKHAPKLRVEFVGHPLAERIVERRAESVERKAESGERRAESVERKAESGKRRAESVERKAESGERRVESVERGAWGGKRKEEQIGDNPQFAIRNSQVVLLLPGSREREVAKIWPIMAKVVDLIPDNVQFVAAAVNEQMAAMIRHPQVSVEIGTAQELMQRATLAITASGTATMECAFYGCPMIVVYKVNWLTYLVGRMVVTVNWLAMPNVIANRTIVPEFIQGDAKPDRIADVARELLEDAGKREAMQKELAAVVKSLGGPGASERAARLILATDQHG